MRKVNAFMLTDVGAKREKNEDYVGMLIEENYFVLSDGMGGYEAGEIASKVIVENLLEQFKINKRDLVNKTEIEDFFKCSIIKAHHEIIDYSKKKNIKNMGGTVCCLFLLEDKYYLAWVGDSRIYYFSQNTLRLITSDHSIVWDLFKNGNITYEQMRLHPFRHVITRAVGVSEELNIDFKCSDIDDIEYFLICSDGLHGELSDLEIEEIINSNQSIEDIANTLVKEANDKGGNDNISVIIVSLKN